MRFLKPVFLTCLALSLCASCGPREQGEDPAPQPDQVQVLDDDEEIGAGFTEIFDRSNKKHVDLVYVGGHSCVLGEDLVFVFRNQKPKKVKFWANPAQTYFWEIQYDGGKPSAEGDFFGAVDPIGCNHNHTTTDNNSGVPNDGVPHYWPYSITVYECVNGAKGPYLCDVDPRVGILP